MFVDIMDQNEFGRIGQKTAEKIFYLSDKGKMNIWFAYLFLKFSIKQKGENLVLSDPEKNSKLIDLEKWLNNLFEAFFELKQISPNYNNFRVFDLIVPMELSGSDYLKSLFTDLKNIHKEILINLFWYTPFIYDGRGENLIFKRDLVEKLFSSPLNAKIFPKLDLFRKRIKSFFKKFFSGLFFERLQNLSIYLFFLADIKYKNSHFSEAIILFHRSLDTLFQGIAFKEGYIQKIGNELRYKPDDNEIFLLKTLEKINEDKQLWEDAKKINTLRRHSLYAHGYNNYLIEHADIVRSKSIEIIQKFLGKSVSELTNFLLISDVVNLEEFFLYIASNQYLFVEQSN